MSRVHRLVALAVTAVLVAACGNGGSTSSSGSATPFNVLVVGSLSTGAGVANMAVVNGMQAAALAINAQGGILGHKIAFKIYDTGGNTTQAVTLVTQALQSQPEGGGTWNFIQSGASSDEQLAELPTVTKYKVPGIAVESSPLLGNPDNFPYHWILGVNINTMVKTIADYMKSQGFKKVGFFYQNNAVGEASDAAIGPALTADGITEVKVSYPATAVDVTPQMQQMQALKPDAVIATAQSGPWIGYVLKARTALGFNVPFVGDATFSGADAYGIAGADNVSGVKYYTWGVDVYEPPDKQSAAEKEFISDLKKVVVTYTVPLHQYGAGWDALYFMKIAAEKANSLDPDKIRAALDSNLKIPSPSPLVDGPNGWGWKPTSVTGHLSTPGPGAFLISDIGPLQDGQAKIDLSSVYPKQGG
jgi:branched-chain amino acid transport system substrate-binding protein